ncbi:DUF805 domain-containing protein [Acinetobacter junii]|uniref:DUF805 domain-containing protein n=1 Tax=Acinetobacter junii TaxID=40215 RepID=UPI00124DE0B7|nr:DUF805 domain-containing protein [Acinetobacter junii]
MKGKILDFSIQTNSGIITGEDNKRYQFTGSEWKEQSIPQRGTDVDFDHTEDGNATGIYLILDSHFVSQSATPLPAQSQTKAQQPPIKQQSSNQGRIDKTEEQYNPWDWYQKCFMNYVNFDGRARRKEFWFFQLIAFIGLTIIAMFSFTFAGIFALIITLPSIAVSIRRLHDTGRSGWWLLIGAIPIIGILMLIYWYAQDGEPQINAFGAAPK